MGRAGLTLWRVHRTFLAVRHAAASRRRGAGGETKSQQRTGASNHGFAVVVSDHGKLLFEHWENARVEDTQEASLARSVQELGPCGTRSRDGDARSPRRKLPGWLRHDAWWPDLSCAEAREQRNPSCSRSRCQFPWKRIALRLDCTRLGIRVLEAWPDCGARSPRYSATSALRSA